MIGNYLNPESVIFELSGTERDEILAELTEKIISLNSSLSRNQVLEALINREDKQSTLVCKNLAVPHADLPQVSDSIVVLGISHKGVEFNLDEPDKELSTAKLFFCIIFPQNKANQHLSLLKDVLYLEETTKFLEKILQAQNCSEICDIISRTGV